MLRPYEERDLDAYHAIRSQPEVARYLYDEPLGLDEAREKLGRLARRGARAGGRLAAGGGDVRESGAVVGDVGLHWVSVQHRTGEIGFVFDPAHQGRGYATEAARAARRLGVRRSACTA